MLTVIRHRPVIYVILAIMTIGTICLSRLLNRLQFGPDVVTQLGKHDKVKVSFHNHILTTATKDSKGQVVVKYQYVADTASVTVEDNGSYTVTNKRFGYGFKPGIAISYSNKLRIGPIAEVLYFDRLGLNIGLGFAPRGYSDPIIFSALSYSIYQNTSVFIGMDQHRNIQGGIKVNF